MVKKRITLFQKYFGLDTSTNTVNKNLDADVFVEEYNNYFYYIKTTDINDYVDEGRNDVEIFLKIGGRSYVFANPLIIQDSNYKYLKSAYETYINIKN